MWRIYDCIANEHDHGLVVLAALICLFGSITTFAIFERAQKATSRIYTWFTILAFSAGTTTWSTHFVAMLAYQQTLPISFMPLETFMSLVFGIVFIGAGLIAMVNLKKSMPKTLMSGTAIGMGTVGLHYIGISGMVMPGTISFANDMIIASVIASVCFGILSLSYIKIQMNLAARFKVIALFVMMIVSLHFTGMAGTNIELGFWEETDATLSRATLTILVTVSSISLLAVAAIIAFFDHKRSHHAERQAKRFRVLADSALEGLIVFRGSQIDDFNTSAKDLLKLCPKSYGITIHKIIGPDQLDLLIEAAESEQKQNPIEMAIRDMKGTEIISQVSCRSIELADGTDGYVLAIRDIRQTRAAQEQAQFVALHDSLTQLPNRKMFAAFAGKVIDEAKHNNTQFAVMVIDLDNFKTINDLYGHEVGDQQLAKVGEILSGQLRETDIIARLGSDEFAILETSIHQPSNAQEVAQRLISTVNNRTNALPDGSTISMSIGVSVFPDDGDKIDALLQHAETAMSKAKQGGKNNHLFFEQGMEASMRERRSIEARLRVAIENDGFTVNFQPIVDSATQSPQSFEALVRWEDDELGFVPPDKFIPIAEETGIIIDIGKQVLHKACSEAVKWPQHIRVAVNLSVVQFEQPGLLDTVKTVLKQTGLPASRLDLEITESIVLSNSERTLEILEKLKASGARISMDDFGTGYSSLSYLQSFPFDKLKIDRVFVSDLETDDNNAAIVKAVVAMGKSLEMCVVAEGVERNSQLARLRSIGCSEVQGYLIAKPMPGDMVEQFIKESRKPPHIVSA